MNSQLIQNEIGKDPMYRIWHAGSQPLFMYIHSGSGSLVTREQTYPIGENVLVLIAPGTYHYTMPDVPDSYVRSKLFLSGAAYGELEELMRRYGVLFDSGVLYARIPEQEQPGICQIFRDAATVGKEDGGEMIYLSCALRFLYYLRKYAASSSSATGFMGKAVRYISQHIAQPLVLEDICRAVGVSKYYFCRQFKLQLGMTVMEYILHTRIVLAREMLENTNLPITRISENCGFSSGSYFCRVFKEVSGFSPLQYRKKNRQQNH